MAATSAQRNRAMRQETLRELLSKQKLVEKVIDSAEKIADLDMQMDAEAVTRLKVANDMRLKLIAKYLPDLKSSEITGDPDAPVNLKTAVELVRAQG